jgi:putative methylase
MLALGAALRGPSGVLGLDIDPEPLSIAQDNCRRIATQCPVSWVRADATTAPLCPTEPTTVVMNPPFGAQTGNEHADRGFLQTTAAIADVSYSIHNAGSEEFVEAFAADNGGTVTHAYTTEFELPRQFDHHEADRRTVDAEVYRIEW